MTEGTNSLCYRNATENVSVLRSYLLQGSIMRCTYIITYTRRYTNRKIVNLTRMRAVHCKFPYAGVPALRFSRLVPRDDLYSLGGLDRKSEYSYNYLFDIIVFRKVV